EEGHAPFGGVIVQVHSDVAVPGVECDGALVLGQFVGVAHAQGDPTVIILAGVQFGHVFGVEDVHVLWHARVQTDVAIIRVQNELRVIGIRVNGDRHPVLAGIGGGQRHAHKPQLFRLGVGDFDDDRGTVGNDVLNLGDDRSRVGDVAVAIGDGDIGGIPVAHQKDPYPANGQRIIDLDGVLIGFFPGPGGDLHGRGVIHG